MMKYDDHGPRGVIPSIIPYAHFKRSLVYTGTRETGSYNHHSQLAKFKGTYYFAWSNGIVDEEAGGQRILISSSVDTISWSEPVCVAGDKDSTIAHNCIALMSTDKMIYLVGMSEDTIKNATSVGMRRIEPETQKMEVYSSSDGALWKKVFSFSDDLRWIFEAPRLTADGHLMCIAATKKKGPAILRWHGAELCEDPEIIPVPEPEGSCFPYGESSWYQTDDGLIIIFWRDEGLSCRVWVNFSEDGGKTFVPPMMSDIPDSMSRVYAGRLKNGVYYLCNNAFPILLNRIHLMLLLSDDGYRFNKVYLLVDDPTSQRFTGLLKQDGYQYPCCLVDEDKLLVGYSVNKEDIECGSVDVKLL
jgi:hypothetical protein